MSKRLRRGRGGELVTLVIHGLPATVSERDVRAALLDRGAGHVASVELDDVTPHEPRTARARLPWRSAQKVIAAPSPDGGWPLTFRLDD